MEPTHKTCPGCGVVKPRAAFNKQAAAKDGLQTYCKPCARERRRAEDPDRKRQRRRRWRLANLDAQLVRERTARTRTVDQRRAYARRYYHDHRVERAAYMKGWRAANRDRRAAYDRRYRAANQAARRLREAARRAQKQGSDSALVTVRDLNRLLWRYRSACAYCETPLTGAFEWDHVIPLARGGRHAIGNLAPSCLDCNGSKHRKYLSEWRAWRNRIATNG